MKIDKQIVIDFLQEGSGSLIKVTDFKDYGYFQEMTFLYNTHVESKQLISINEKQLINFIRRRKINQIINKNEQNIKRKIEEGFQFVF